MLKLEVDLCFRVIACKGFLPKGNGLGMLFVDSKMETSVLLKDCVCEIKG